MLYSGCQLILGGVRGNKLPVAKTQMKHHDASSLAI
jgi:hypothetical protein